MKMFGISHRAMAYLIYLLKSHNIDNIPSSVYMLTRNKQTVPYSTEIMANGQFAYISMKENIIYAINNGLINPENMKKDSNNNILLDIIINVDGMPLYKSSQITIWPILFKIPSMVNPLPIALYCGLGKPDVFSYLQKLANELLDLINNGICYMGNIYKIKQSSILFVCDAPARSYLQCVLSHTAKLGCSYCQCEGEYFMHRVVYPCNTSCEHSDASYALYEENNQQGNFL